MLQLPAMSWCQKPGMSWRIAQLKAVGHVRWNDSLHLTSQHCEGSKEMHPAIKRSLYNGRDKVIFDVFPAERIPSNRSVEMPMGSSKCLRRELDHTHHWPQSHMETQAHKAQGTHCPKKGHFMPLSREIILFQPGSCLGWKAWLEETTLQH